MAGYFGNIPTPQATQTRDTFTATSGQTSFATSGYTVGMLDVYLNGVKLLEGSSADFVASNGSDVVLNSGASSGDKLEVVSYSTFETNSGVFTGDFSVDSPTFKVDSSNNRVGIGTTSPSELLHIENTSSDPVLRIAGPAAGNPMLEFRQTTTQKAYILFNDTNENLSIASDGEITFLYGGSTEGMCITSDGDITVGDGTTLNTNTKFTIMQDGASRAADTYRATSTTTSHIQNWYSDVSGSQTIQAVIEASGAVESRTSDFSGTSDRTLKENITDCTNQWADIKALKFKNFNFIGESDRKMLGVIAQDVEASGMKGLVKTSEETGKMSVRYSVMYMKAVIALQEAMARIETLETKVKALEAK